MRLLYQGMLRTLLVLLHDFPEFLSDYHLSFCDVIPPTCIQLRNLVLAAFPRSMRLPDPFTPNLKVRLCIVLLLFLFLLLFLLLETRRRGSCTCSGQADNFVVRVGVHKQPNVNVVVLRTIKNLPASVAVLFICQESRKIVGSVC